MTEIADLDTKEKISIRLDRDILDHFRSQGSRWQTRINDVLREVMMEQQPMIDGRLEDFISGITPEETPFLQSLKGKK